MENHEENKEDKNIAQTTPPTEDNYKINIVNSTDWYTEPLQPTVDHDYPLTQSP